MTSKPKVRGGIVGSGFAANLHYEGIRRVYGTDVDLVGVFSPTADNAQRFAGRHGLRTFSSLEALLDEVQVVHVCASPAAHEAITVAALGARRARHRRETADGMVRRWHCRFPCVRRVHAECSGRCACEYRSHAGGGSQIQGHDPVRGKLGVCAGYPEGARDHREDRRPGTMDARRRSSLGLAQQGLRLLASERRRCADRQGCASADGCPLPQAGRRSRAQRPADPSGSRQRAHAFSDPARRLRRPRFPAHRLSRRRGLLVDPCGVRGRHRGRHLRVRDRHGRHPQLARSDGQQPSRGVQHQSQHGDADLQPVRSPVPRHLRGREDRHQAGLGADRARRGLHHRLSRRRSRRSIAQPPLASRPRAMAAWLPTASRRSTAPIFQPSAKAPRWRCARSEAGRPVRARSRTGRGCRAA